MPSARGLFRFRRLLFQLPSVIFFIPNPDIPPPQRLVFAESADLGLGPDDDISSLTVFDDNGDGQFNGTDQVMFSLTRGSPSPATIGNAGAQASSADVFAVDVNGSTIAIATAASLGLNGATDSIDALDFILCTDAAACARLHGIRAPLPNIPVASTWGLIVTALLVLVSATVVLRRRGASFPSAG